MRPDTNLKLADLPSPDITQTLPLSASPFERPEATLIEQLRGVGSVAASAVLRKLGVQQTRIEGPLPRVSGARVVGPAITLQFMPQREDIVSGLGQERVEQLTTLSAVLAAVVPGDVLCVQAFGDPYTGCLDESTLTAFAERGGVGAVVDGCISAWPQGRALQVPVWTRGVMPNDATQPPLFPWGYNVPIACARVLVLPGDIVIADDDGVVLVPSQLASIVAEYAGKA